MSVFLPSKSALLVALAALVTLACSLGTEVGNGVKPTSPSPGQGSGSNAGGGTNNDQFVQASGAMQPNTSQGGTSGLPTGDLASVSMQDTQLFAPNSSGVSAGTVPTSPISSSVIGAAQASSAVHSPTNLSSVAGGANSVISDSDLAKENLPLLALNLAFAGCESPLADKFASPPKLMSLTVLGAKIASFKVALVNNGTAFEVRDVNSNFVVNVTPSVSNAINSDFVVSSDNGFGAPWPPKANCSKLVTTTPNVPVTGLDGVYTLRRVTLETSRGTTQLSWYLSSGASPKLVRATLSADPNAMLPYAIFDIQ